MTSGITIIDGSTQTLALTLADVSAGMAALAVPTGSALLAGALLRLLGASAIGATALGFAVPGMFGSVLGPACLVVIAAREIFWFGLAYKADAACAVLIFLAVALLRTSVVAEPVGPSTKLAELSPVVSPAPEGRGSNLDLANRYVEALATIPGEVQPIGPPVPLSFVASVSLTTLSFGKVFEPIGEDLDEEGEQWAKRSSRSLYDYDGEDDAINRDPAGDAINQP